jgi:hypothetical protein
MEQKKSESVENSFSNRCLMFQLSILKNKKVLFLKKEIRPREFQQMAFTVLIVSEGFGLLIFFLDRS